MAGTKAGSNGKEKSAAGATGTLPATSLSAGAVAARLARLERMQRLTTAEARKKDAREKIELGGLIVKAGCAMRNARCCSVC
ncbi:hypothetical protein GCM10023069_18550 [Shinella granuli]